MANKNILNKIFQFIAVNIIIASSFLLIPAQNIVVEASGYDYCTHDTDPNTNSTVQEGFSAQSFPESKTFSPENVYSGYTNVSNLFTLDENLALPNEENVIGLDGGSFSQSTRNILFAGIGFSDNGQMTSQLESVARQAKNDLNFLDNLSFAYLNVPTSMNIDYEEGSDVLIIRDNREADEIAKNLGSQEPDSIVFILNTDVRYRAKSFTFTEREQVDTVFVSNADQGYIDYSVLHELSHNFGLNEGYETFFLEIWLKGTELFLDINDLNDFTREAYNNLNQEVPYEENGNTCFGAPVYEFYPGVENLMDTPGVKYMTPLQKEIMKLQNQAFLQIRNNSSGPIEGEVGIYDEYPQSFVGVSSVTQGLIKQRWNNWGGLSVFGLPMENERVDLIEGGEYNIQWFQRNRMELHPENQPPYDVLLGRLGAELLEYRGIDWQKGEWQEAPIDGCLYFAETKKNVCGEILQRWQSDGIDLNGNGVIEHNDSLALFGLPLTPVIPMEIEGNEYQVQWFERARMELHPENQPPYNVLLGLLGCEARQQEVPGQKLEGCPPPQ